MKIRNLLLAGILVAASAVFATATMSTPAQANVCPSTIGKGPFGGGGAGNATDCNLEITLSNSGYTTTSGPGTNPSGVAGTYDSIEDALIGLVNNSTSTTITSFTLTCTNGCFDFDGDGIDGYGGTGNAADTTGYGGPKITFSSIAANFDSGIVTVAGGLAPGQSTYFSLEEPADLNTHVAVPEPASLALLGTALFGFGLMRRRRKGA